MVQSTGRETVSWGRRRSDCATRGGRQEDAERAGCRPGSTPGRCAFLAQGRAGQTKDPRILVADGISSRRPTNSNDAKPDGFRRWANFSNEWSSRCTRDRRTRSAMEFHAIVCFGMVAPTPEDGQYVSANTSRRSSGYLKLPSARAGIRISSRCWELFNSRSEETNKTKVEFFLYFNKMFKICHLNEKSWTLEIIEHKSMFMNRFNQRIRTHQFYPSVD